MTDQEHAIVTAIEESGWLWDGTTHKKGNSPIFIFHRFDHADLEELDLKVVLTTGRAFYKHFLLENSGKKRAVIEEGRLKHWSHFA